MNRPNFVYILADDMGYGDLSCLNGNCGFRTPNLDRLAAEGMAFTDAHSSSAVCTPSRYSILTGRYNWRSELKYGVLHGYSPHLIEPGRMTVATYLKEHGYRTACIGKWHLGMDMPLKNGEWIAHEAFGEWPRGAYPDVDFSRPLRNGPCTYGFDYFYGISGSLDMAPYVYWENSRATELPDREFPGDDTPKGLCRRGPQAPHFRHERVTPELTERSCRYIEERAKSGEPFFLYFPLPSPHTPILPEEFTGKSGTNEYGDFCLMVDWCVGRIMETLEANGVADNTVLVFTSDNGCSPNAGFEELKKFGHNPSYVFRGHKADIYEGGHRIPLLVRWPERIPAGTVSAETVCLVDLMATCCEILGETLPYNAGEDSVSNLPVWLKRPLDKPLREATVHHSVFGNFSIRQGRWKLELCPGSGGWSYPAPGEEPEGSPQIQLYDLSCDISERENCCREHPDVVAALTKLLTRYVLEGRSTPGLAQSNTGAKYWPELNWLTSNLTKEETSVIVNKLC